MRLWLRRLRATLPLLVELLLVGGYLFLDLRDLYYKTAYLGPTNSFAFFAITDRALETTPLVPTVNVTTEVVVSASPRASGWASFLTRCDRLQPASRFFFIGAMGINCRVGGDNTTIIPQLYLSSSVRADSMAWAACKLLYRHRRPTVCADAMVTGFTRRYGFDDVDVGPSRLALPETNAERELFELLHVIALSEPLVVATCVEAFEFHGAGAYTTHVFGCGAPNAFASAFVGIYASAFKDLHRDKAWLTVDTIDLMGLQFVLRQNVKSEFSASVHTTTGAVTLWPKTVTNFSSSGGLYVAMLAIDVVLMVYNLWSGIEISRLMILPLLKAHWVSETDPDALHGVVQNYRAVLTCPLYRSRPIVFLTAATQLVSWVLILPNSIIFTWSTSSRVAKIQAYLSSLRLWTLLLLSANMIWDAIVFINERAAYAIARRTYVAVYEVMIIGALVSYLKRADLFAVTGVKYALERQRYTDTTSFLGTKAFGNSYNPHLEGVLWTPGASLWTVYRLLAELTLWGLVAIVCVLVTRFVVLTLWHHVTRWRAKRRARVAATTKIQFQVSEAADDHLFTKRNAFDAKRPATPPVQEDEADDDDDETDGPYERLPLEKLLNIPIRALCLVRSGLDMETAGAAGHRYIRTPYMLEHGVVLDSGRLRVRHGFFSHLEPEVDLIQYIPPTVSDALALVYERRRRKSMRQKAQ